MRCPHCYASAGKRSLLELTTEESKALIDQLASAGVFRIAFSGGEPLIRKDILELCEYATKKKIKTSITTNATLLTESLAKKLYDCGVDTVQVNLEGAHRKTHDQVRPNTFDKTLSAAKMLKEIGFNVLVGTVVTRSNLEEVPEIYKIAESLGAYSYRLLRLIPTGRGKNQIHNTLTKPYYQRFMQLYREMRTKKKKTELILGCYWCFAQLLCCIKVYSRPCGAGISICSMTPDGYVIPCSLFSDPTIVATLPVNNIRDKDFKEIWMNSEVMKAMRAVPESLIGKCSFCIYKNVCSGGCRAETYSLTGNLFESDPMCWFNPIAPKRE
jgi:radical SAM protein with 4Fe4S-binding SPASM domain